MWSPVGHADYRCEVTANFSASGCAPAREPYQIEWIRADSASGAERVCGWLAVREARLPVREYPAPTRVTLEGGRLRPSALWASADDGETFACIARRLPHIDSATAE